MGDAICSVPSGKGTLICLEAEHGAPGEKALNGMGATPGKARGIQGCMCRGCRNAWTPGPWSQNAAPLWGNQTPPLETRVPDRELSIQKIKFRRKSALSVSRPLTGTHRHP